MSFVCPGFLHFRLGKISVVYLLYILVYKRFVNAHRRVESLFRVVAIVVHRSSSCSGKGGAWRGEGRQEGGGGARRLYA